MASLLKKTVTRYLDDEGNRVNKDVPGARKKRVKLKPWYGKYRDDDGIERKSKLCNNKTAARQMLAELERMAEQQRAGLCSPFESHATRPLSEHLSEFEQSLRDKGNSESHCDLVSHRASRIVKGCNFRFIGDISSSRVQSFLAELKHSDSSQQTVNHYLRAVKQFTRWLVRDRRRNDNRLVHLEGGNVKTDLRIERRELTNDEIDWLLKITRDSIKRLGLSGWERYTLYVTALGTGLRASELASLTPSHFDLNTTPPTVRIDAVDEKSRRGDTLPLPPDLVELLNSWFVSLGDKSPLWPGVWAKQKRASRIIRKDLEAARATWNDDAKTDERREDREKSDFLCYRNHDGKQADFHALRHTYLSRLGRSGASAKVMQRLAGHSTVELTLGRYTRAGLNDLASAVEQLPTLPGGFSDLHETTIPNERNGKNNNNSLVAPMIAPVGAKTCKSVMTDEEIDGSDDDDDEVPQVQSLQSIEDDCGSMKSGEGGIRRASFRKSLIHKRMQP